MGSKRRSEVDPSFELEPWAVSVEVRFGTIGGLDVDINLSDWRIGLRNIDEGEGGSFLFLLLDCISGGTLIN